jgi:ferredoxin
MADKSSKVNENAPGKFYVDDQCIACLACIIEAKRFFQMNDDDTHAFVKLQPKTKEEIAECMEALQSCPVEAIGSDGE